MTVPDKLDIMQIQIEPHVGSEAGGHRQLTKSKIKGMSAIDLLKYYRTETRPVLIVSKKEFNQFGEAECMPITSHNHMVNPFKQMMIKMSTKRHVIHGYVAPFQIMGFDYIARNGKIVDHLDEKLRPEIDYYIKGIFF